MFYLLKSKAFYISAIKFNMIYGRLWVCCEIVLQQENQLISTKHFAYFQYQLYRNQYLKLIGDHAKIQHIKCGRSGLTQIYVSTMFYYFSCLWKCNYWLKISSLTQFLFHFISLQVCEAFERLRYLKKTLNLVRSMFLS